MTTTICANCGHENLSETFRCAKCHQPMAQVSSSQDMPNIGSDLQPKKTWGTLYFNASAWLEFHIQDAHAPVVLRPKPKITLGRRDPNTGLNPSLDLTPYNAALRGVSRHHASILWAEGTLTLLDESSANGTYLNGQQLHPKKPQLLRDGDEIRLGKLICHIYFK